MIDEKTIVKSSAIHAKLKITDFDNGSFWTYGEKDIVFREVMDSSNNTDNAWQVLTVVHFHDAHHELPETGEIIWITGKWSHKMGDIKWVDAKKHGLTEKFDIDALEKVVKKHEANEQAKRDELHQSTWAMVEKMAEQITSQQSTIEHMSNEFKEVKSQQSAMQQMTDKQEQQHLMMEQMAEKLAKIESQNKTTPSIDHNGEELDTSATYQLLLDFNGSKVFFNYEIHVLILSNFSTVPIILL